MKDFGYITEKNEKYSRIGEALGRTAGINN